MQGTIESVHLSNGEDRLFEKKCFQKRISSSFVRVTKHESQTQQKLDLLNVMTSLIEFANEGEN